MLNRDLKKFNIVVSSGLTLTFEAAINTIGIPSIRQILNPVGIILAFFLSIFIMHKIKCISIDMQIRNFEAEIVSHGNGHEKAEKCREDIVRLKRQRNKLDIF